MTPDGEFIHHSGIGWKTNVLRSSVRLAHHEPSLNFPERLYPIYRSDFKHVNEGNAPTTTFPAKWLTGRNKHVTARPKKQETPGKEPFRNYRGPHTILIPSKLYKKIVPMRTSIGASSFALKISLKDIR